MIRISDDIALRELLRGFRCANETHKERLWERLQQEARAEASDELTEDELEMAAGGVKPPDDDVPSRRPS